MSTLRFPPPRVRLAILLSIGLLLLAGCGAGSGSFFSTGTFLVVAGLFLASLGPGGCAGEKFFVVGRPTPASSPSPTVSPSPGPSPAPPPLDFAGRHTGLGGFEPLDVALGDLDGDGDLDAVSADAFFARTVVVNLNNGRGGLQLGGYYSVGYGTRGVATGDVDGDADLDIAAANYISGTMGVLFNQGDGTFVSGTPVDTGYATTSVDLGDLDGDGDLDAVAGNSAGDFVAVLRNDGSGTFVGAGTFATQGPTVEVALGDLDGDGALDLAAVNDQGAGGQVAVLLNEGSGAFGAAYLFDAGPYPSRLALGDINGDGALDVATDSGYGDAYLLINQGSRGSPDFAGPYSFYALYPQGVALGDVDGDGHIDLVTASRYSEPERPYGFSLAILPGDGQGGFGEPRTFYTGEFPRTAVLGDADGDGNLDAFTADTYSYTVSCLLNRGDGTLEEAPVFAAGPDGSDLAAGDLDGDGDLDLVAS
ncbi:MAG TPA: VCBS repeat-containing protein, partial [Candidatus Nitrosotenuis sp.]|nr:VCBS repeat-containing protein [Candidatus Nitrosotenuis sp.]